MKKVLILMATYNGSLYLRAQLDSILNQVNVSIEILISDDKSTDNTIEIIKEYIKKGHNISYIESEENLKIPALNFFKLIDYVKNESKYDYFAFADQDDFWQKDKIENAIKLCENKNAELYASSLTLWDGEKNIGQINKSNKEKKFDHLFESASAGCTYLFTPSLLQIIKKNLPKLPKNWNYMSHDWIIYFLAKTNKLKVVVDQNSYINYRQHNNNVFGRATLFNPKPLIAKFKYFQDDWYINHLNNFKLVINEDFEEYAILEMIKSESTVKRVKGICQYGSQFSRYFYKRVIINISILLNNV